MLLALSVCVCVTMIVSFKAHHQVDTIESTYSDTYEYRNALLRVVCWVNKYVQEKSMCEQLNYTHTVIKTHEIQAVLCNVFF